MNEQETEQRIYDYAAQLLVEPGKGRADVVQALMAEGLDEEYAKDVVSALCDQCKNECLKAVGVGGLWFIGGVVLTVSTYNMADAGGTYLVAYGPVIYGIYQMIANFCKMCRYT